MTILADKYLSHSETQHGLQPLPRYPTVRTQLHQGKHFEVQLNLGKKEKEEPKRTKDRLYCLVAYLEHNHSGLCTYLSLNALDICP
jgi:hypothetical protein